MHDPRGALVLVAIVAYIPLCILATRGFRRYMDGRRWSARHGAFYAALLAFLCTPGCIELDLRHGNTLPLPLPAWVALASGSIWGGLLPLCVGWFIARSHVQSRVAPSWALEQEPAPEHAREDEPPSQA